MEKSRVPAPLVFTGDDMTRRTTGPAILYPLLAVLACSLAAELHAGPKLTLAVTGRWSIGTFRAAQLSGGAGTDFTGTQTSASNQVRLTIRNTGTTGWGMTVRRVDTYWNPAMRVYVQRTDTGTGLGTISGGMGFQELTAMDTIFLSGTGDFSAIPLQFELTGFSAVVGIGAFSTTIFYTITEY